MVKNSRDSGLVDETGNLKRGRANTGFSHWKIFWITYFRRYQSAYFILRAFVVASNASLKSIGSTMTQKILPLSWDNTRVRLAVSRGERRADTRENDTTVDTSWRKVNLMWRNGWTGTRGPWKRRCSSRCDYLKKYLSRNCSQNGRRRRAVTVAGNASYDEHVIRFTVGQRTSCWSRRGESDREYT